MLGDTRVAANSPPTESQFHLAGFQDAFAQKRKREMVEEKPPQDVADYDSDDDDKEDMKPKPGKKTRGRVKIHMEYIPNKLRRYTTFSKRKSGMMKKVMNCFCHVFVGAFALTRKNVSRLYYFVLFE